MNEMLVHALADNQVEQSMEQLYSEALGKFLADRFVVGTCPKCKYEVGNTKCRLSLFAKCSFISNRTSTL
jgi:methionyl-tRNA synthetase